MKECDGLWSLGILGSAKCKQTKRENSTRQYPNPKFLSFLSLILICLLRCQCCHSGNMKILRLSVDIWFIIMEHLSLADLSAIDSALGSTINVDWSVRKRIIKRFAIKVISTMFAFESSKFALIFSNNGPCYRFRMRHPRAGQYRHQQDHGHNPPCGGEYSPHFPTTVEFSRTFSSLANDETKTEMTLFANNGKLFEGRCARKFLPCPNDFGPSELIAATVDFLEDASSAGCLRLELNTFDSNIKDTFSDSLHSRSHVTRTVAHHIPLQRAGWIDGNRKFTELPLDWFEFWTESEIRAVSTFSKELVSPSLPGTIDEWEWKMLSFKTEWALPMSLSSELLTSKSLGSEGQSRSWSTVYDLDKRISEQGAFEFCHARRTDVCY